MAPLKRQRRRNQGGETNRGHHGLSVLVGLLLQQEKKYHQTISKQQQAKHGFDRPEHAAQSKSRETPAKRIQIEREQKARRQKRSASRATRRRGRAAHQQHSKQRDAPIRHSSRTRSTNLTGRLRGGTVGFGGREMEAEESEEARETRGGGEKWEADLTFTASPFRSAASLQCCKPAPA